ncbi:MAG: DUF4124 domain-containing protein [Gammaproteobacteria bacterium]|nr:DUF4124 domain-containing protein [Gammaproteobacteria bacterium]
MQNPLEFTAALILALIAGPSAAVTVFQCEDELGNRTFESACPPGTKEVQQKDYVGGGAAPAPTQAQPAGDLPAVTLYLVPDCESCAQMREFLEFREIPYTTKDVKQDLALQVELKQRSGDLRAPTVMVGDKAIVGFNRGALLAALQESGHVAPEEIPAGPAPGTAAPEASPATAGPAPQ